MREVAKMFIALQPDLKAWIEEQAKLQERSMNTIVNRALRQARDAEQREKVAG